MKWIYSILIITLVVAFVMNVDIVIVFMLSGFIPTLNITLAPSTMLAVPVASTIMMIALSKRRAVYRRCLRYYDTLAVFGKKHNDSAANNKPKLPKRRYQEL